VSSRLMLVLAFVSMIFGGGGGIIPVRVCYASSLPPFILIMSFSLLGSDVVSFCARFLLRPLSYKFIMVQLYYYVELFFFLALSFILESVVITNIYKHVRVLLLYLLYIVSRSFRFVY
jgi:hypothetical protein